MYKQIIIARKDLNMSAGKLAAQVSHASMAFLIQMIKNNINTQFGTVGRLLGKADYETYPIKIEQDLYEQWINGEFTKCVLQAKNKNNLLKAKTMAEELGMKEGEDFFLIRDNCHTELTPEEDGKTLTCIGFKPMDSEIIDKIGKKFHMYVG
jgi:PTH2 family peptidyl-tRNA hydrolase